MRHLIAILNVVLFCGPWTSSAAFTPEPDQSLAGVGAGLPGTRSFGQSLSANGQFLAIGAPGSAAAAIPGAVWIYTRDGDQYTLLNVLQAPSPASGDGFGQHVQFVSDQLLVGAPFRTVSGVGGRGEVFAYNRVAGQFTLAQTLQPGAAVSSGDWFGFHLSADSGWLAVGVPRSGVNDEGQVQLYRYDGDLETWIYHSAQTATATTGRLGLRVLVRGDRVFASAVQEPASSFSLGYVYEYLRSGNGAGASFAQVQRFRPSVFPVADSPQAFGSALALSPDGNQLIVGAPFDVEPDDTQRGAAFVFVRAGGLWTQAERIPSPAGTRAQNFAGAVVFDGNDRVLIGDIRESNSVNVQTGAVHEFRRQMIPPGASWTLGQSWLRGVGTSQDFFGNAVLVDNRNVVIASSGHDDPVQGADVGRAYVYSALFKDSFE